MLLADIMPPKTRRLVDEVGPKFDVTNVAYYYFHHDEETWNLDQFVGARPPFKKCWVEYRWPRSVRSVERGENTLKCFESGKTPYFGGFVTTVGEDKFDVAGTVYYVDSRNAIEIVKGYSIRYVVNSDASIGEISMPRSMGDDAEEMALSAVVLHPVMLAFSFANCKNIEVVDVEAPVKLQKARMRRDKLPLVTYKIINVLPLAKAQSPRSRTVVSADGQGVALHIRRGHFAHYGPKYGRGKLFGRLEGQFWIPQAAVGTAEAGVSVHDYAVAAKE